MAINVCEAGVHLEQQDDDAGSLGVVLKCNNKTRFIKMRQYGLIERIIEALGLYDGMVTNKHTPLEGNQLVKDKYGPPVHGQFNGSSFLGIIMYLTGHTPPNISYDINCCARYMFSLKYLNGLELKRIGRYLK